MMSWGLGTKSEQVAKIKRFLYDLGFSWVGSLDDVYNAATETAVKDFQRTYGFNETGVVDEDTLIALETVHESPQTFMKPPQKAGTPVPMGRVVSSNATIRTLPNSGMGQDQSTSEVQPGANLPGVGVLDSLKDNWKWIGLGAIGALAFTWFKNRGMGEEEEEY